MSETEDYLWAWTELADHYAAGRVHEALAEADRMAVRFPDRRFHIAYYRAALLAAAKELSAALDLIHGTAAAGGWWSSSQLADPDFVPLREEPAFQAAVAHMKDRERRARDRAERARAELTLLQPEEPPKLAVVALHMYGMTAAETARHWQHLTEPVLVVVPESTQRDADENPMWTADDLTERDVVEAVRSCIPTDLPLVLAGASQGARPAIRLALAGRFPDCCGFAGIVGTVSPTELPERCAPARGWLLAGGLDTYMRRAQHELMNELVRRDLDCRYEEVRGLGHLYPEDFAERFGRAIDYLLG